MGQEPLVAWVQPTGSASSHVFSVTPSSVRQTDTRPSGVHLVLSLQQRVREMSSWSSKAQPETSFLHPHHVPPTPTLACAAFRSLSPSSDLPLPLKPLLFPESYFPSIHTPNVLSHVYRKRSPSCSNYPLSHLNLFTCWSPHWWDENVPDGGFHHRALGSILDTVWILSITVREWYSQAHFTDEKAQYPEESYLAQGLTAIKGQS